MHETPRDKRHLKEGSTSPEVTRYHVAAELYGDLLKGLHPFLNPTLYNHLQTLHGYHKELLIERYLPKEVQELITTLPYVVESCYFHPGIAVRSKQFLTFVENNFSGLKTTPSQDTRMQTDFLEKQALLPTIQSVAPLDIIKRFAAEHTTSIHLYRGMALTPIELQAVLSTQLLAPGMRQTALGIKIMEGLLDPTLLPYGNKRPRPTCFKGDTIARISGDTPREATISIATSEYPQVAASIGWYDSGRKPDQDLALYIFELEIPELMTYTEEGMMNDKKTLRAITVEDTVYEGSGLEVLIPFAILPEWIMDIQMVPTPPRWKPR